MFEKQIAELNLQIKTLSREYWRCKNLCACYTDWYGEWNDNQMVEFAYRAQRLGEDIAELKELRENLCQSWRDSLI